MPGGRRLKLNEEMLEDILTYKENGLSDKDVCDIVGIDQSSFYNWIKEGETGISVKHPGQKASNLEIKVELVKGLKKARAAFKAYHLQNINNAARKEWTASAWILERMYPKEFGRIDRVVAMQGEAGKDNGMLNEILDYLGMSKNNVHADGETN